MLIRISSKHFLHVQSNTDLDNEQSNLCQIVNSTNIEDNQHVMTDEIDKVVFTHSDHMSENNSPIDLRITSKRALDCNEVPIISKGLKSSINIINSNESNNQQPVFSDFNRSNLSSSNYMNFPEKEKINSKCLNSIVYTEQLQRYYCPKRCRGPLPIITPIRIRDDCAKLPTVKFRSQRNCRRQQKRALQKGKDLKNCKASSTTDLNK